MLGIRQRGLQSTEELLREGAVITGIGELTRTKSKTLTLQPPLNGAPFYLTSMSITSLLRKLDDHKKTYRLVKCIPLIIHKYNVFHAIMVFQIVMFYVWCNWFTNWWNSISTLLER